MTKTELLAAARQVLGDEDSTPYLWSDAELSGYIQDAEQEAAERADLIKVSGVSTYCAISIVAGTASYATNALVYEVEKARISGQSYALKRTSREKLDSEDEAWEDDSDTPYEYFLEGNILTLHPKPTANSTLNMVVLRLPVTPMGTSPEIGARHHRRMLDWVYHLAYDRRNADTFNPKKALDFESRFEASFGRRWDAKEQTRRLRHTPIEMKDTQ